MTSILLAPSRVNNMASLSFSENYVNSSAFCHNNLVWGDLDCPDIYTKHCINDQCGLVLKSRSSKCVAALVRHVHTIG